MEKSTASILIAPLDIPSKYSVFKRIANLALLIIGITICLNLWLLSSEHSSNWHKKQSNQLGSSLSALSAKLVAKAILADDTESLKLQLQSIIDDPNVHSASLYDGKGRQLADNQSASSIVAAYKLNTDKPLVFVEPITHKNTIIGYLRLMLIEQKVMAYHDTYQNEFYQKLTVLMLLACAAGALLARVFYKAWYKHKLAKTTEKH